MNEQIGNKINDKTYIKLTPFKGFILENFPFIEADFDAITNYQLLCKVIEYLNNVISNQNTVQELGTDLVNAYNSLVDAVNLAIGEFEDSITTDFNTLHDYVYNYFDNLDVQEEINTKLDDMVQDGTLQEIIADYLNSKAVFGFDNVASMKTSTNLINGSYAETLGYYNKNDGGSALYKIRNITNNDIVDDMTIIALQNTNLIAEYIIQDKINVLQFGIDNTGTTSMSTKVNNILTKFKGNNIYFPKGEYLFDTTLYIDANTTLSGEGKNSTIFETNSAINILELKNSFSYNVSVEKIGFDGNSIGLIGIYLHKTEYSIETVDMRIRLEHLAFTNFTDWCLKIGGDTTERVIADSYYNDINCSHFSGGGILLTNRCTDSYFNNIRVGGGSTAGKENIVVRGYNLHFSNCKSFYSGTEQTPKDAWLFEGCACLYGEIEAQDSSHYGVKIDSCNAFNLVIMADRCTLATDTHASVYALNSHYGTIKITNSNYETSTQYGSNKVIQMYNCNNLEIEINTTQVDRIIEMMNNDNSYNITYKLNGYEIYDVTPTFNAIDYNDNGVTVKSVGNNQLLVNGTSTAQVDIDLKGNFGASAVLSMIPANSLVKFITNDDYGTDVYLQVFNVTDVLVGANQKILNFDNNTNITGVKIRIPNATTINKILTPRILVIKNNR